MVSSTSILGVVASAATLTLAMTPSGFSPSNTNDLIVNYGNKEAMNGALVAKAATARAPTLATANKLNGTSFAVLMVDIDVPSSASARRANSSSSRSGTGGTTTFLHWVQTDLTQSTKKSKVRTASGITKAYKLSAANTSALVAYTQPSPPNRNPTSHRYTEILLDTSSMTAAQLSTLKKAVGTRTGFNVANVLSQMGMTASVVAGNSFNVSAVSNSTSSGSTATKTKTKTAAAATETGKSTASSTAGASTTTAATAAAESASATTSTVAKSLAGGVMNPAVGSAVAGLGLALFMSLVL